MVGLIHIFLENSEKNKNQKENTTMSVLNMIQFQGRKLIAMMCVFSLLVPSTGSAFMIQTTDASKVRELRVANTRGADTLLANAFGAPLAQAASLGDDDQIRFGFDNPMDYFTNSNASFNVGQWLKKDDQGRIPDFFVNAIKAELAKRQTEGKIKSYVVHDFVGQEIDIHVTHVFGKYNASVHKLIYEAVVEAFKQAQAAGIYVPGDQDLLALNFQEQMKAMRVKAVDDWKKERGSESVEIAKGINVAIGAANIKLFHQFVIPGSTPVQKLGLSKARGWRFVVQKTEDILAGAEDPKEWEFVVKEALSPDVYRKNVADQMARIQSSLAGYTASLKDEIATGLQGLLAILNSDEILTDAKTKVAAQDAIKNILAHAAQIEGFTGKDKLISEIKRFRKVLQGLESRYEAIRLLALLSQQNDYQIVRVYPAEQSGLPENEPVASVEYQPVFADGRPALNPKIFYRSQSGGDAVGGIAAMVFDANMVPGGENGDYFVATYPTTLEEARKPISKPGIGYFVAYGYQSEQNGAVPSYGYEDLVAQDPESYLPEQEDAEKLARVFSSHGDSQPYLAPHAAEVRVEHLRQEQDHLFVVAPKESDIDPFLEPVEARINAENWTVVGDDKADMGGILGHTRVPEYMVAVYKATLEWAREKGWITDGNTFGIIDHERVNDRENRGIGDDGHLVMLGEKSIYGRQSHQLSFLAFTRAYHYAVVLNHKPYGLGQDYQGPEAKVAKSNPEQFSQYDERYFELLARYLPQSAIDAGAVDKVRQAWTTWQTSGKSTQLVEPFSGNVTQQGIGSARYAFNPKEEQSFDILAGDKMGPPAFNLLIQESVFAAADSGKFPNGLVLEIWDLKAFPPGVTPENATPAQLKEIPTKRIFLDAVKDREAVKKYLADSDRFNVRNIWAKSSPDWDITRPAQFLDRPLASSSVTRLGILTGGEYVGKDDPLIIGNTKLLGFMYEFLRTRPLVVQGDMNGSHWEWAVPKRLSQAVATVRSHPILAAARYTISRDGNRLTRVKDIFGDRFQKIRREALRFNRDFDKAQFGQVEPHGANRRTVEGSYELAKILRDMNDDKNLHLVKNMKDDDGKARKPAGNVVKKLYEAVPNAASLGQDDVKLPGLSADLKQQFSALLSQGNPASAAAGSADTDLNTIRAYFGITSSSAPSTGVIFSRALFFDEGLGVALPNLKQAFGSETRVVVVTTPQGEADIVAMVNQNLSEDEKILTAATIQEASRILKERYRVEAVKYVGNGNEVEAETLRRYVEDVVSLSRERVSELVSSMGLEKVVQEFRALVAIHQAA